MGGSSQQSNNDNVLVKPEKNNVNVQVEEDFDYHKWLKEKVLSQISENKYEHIYDFLFGETLFMGSQGPFVNTALRQMNKFMYYWATDLDDQTRKIIVTQNFNGGGGYIPYDMYTNSPLWKYQSSVLKYIYDFTCQNCKKRLHPEMLVAHHLSYKHIGSELYHLEDVELLCMNCHAKVHEKEGYGE